MIIDTRLSCCALLLMFACLAGCSDSSNLEFKYPPPPSTLKIKVTPPQTTYSLKQYANYDSEKLTNAFLVHVEVTNPSPTPGTIWVMGCSSYEHWKTDNKEVSIGFWGCDGNAPLSIILGSTNANTNGLPGRIHADYSDDLPLLIRPSAKGKELVFRMGFSPGTNHDLLFHRDKLAATVWSDKIQIKVTE